MLFSSYLLRYGLFFFKNNLYCPWWYIPNMVYLYQINVKSLKSIKMAEFRKEIEVDGCTIDVEVHASPEGGSFECYDTEIGEDSLIEGELEIEGIKVTGYDGVFELPNYVQEALGSMGYDCSEL